MNIDELLAKEKGEETKYVPCNMPFSLYEQVVEIARREDLSTSKTMVVAARLLVESYDGAGGPQDGQEEVIEGGGEAKP